MTKRGTSNLLNPYGVMYRRGKCVVINMIPVPDKFYSRIRFERTCCSRGPGGALNLTRDTRVALINKDATATAFRLLDSTRPTSTWWTLCVGFVYTQDTHSQTHTHALTHANTQTRRYTRAHVGTRQSLFLSRVRHISAVRERKVCDVCRESIVRNYFLTIIFFQHINYIILQQ